MPSRIALTHGHGASLESVLGESFRLVRPRVIGIASAFVSVYGAEWAVRVGRQVGANKCRLIAGVDHAITHPEALSFAMSEGWEVKFGVASKGIFHPKFFVGGERFARNGSIHLPALVYAGSANLTRRALGGNVECGILAEMESISGAADAFAQMWRTARSIDDRSLRDYSAIFAETNRRRSAEEIEALGISETQGSSRSRIRRLLQERPPVRSSVAVEFANAAWAGLQSFTGGYVFQVEFPRSAGEVVRGLIGTRTSASGYVDVFCPDDGRTVPMKFAFYSDNCMFRLNIPNDVGNVTWARSHHEGIAFVSHGPTGAAPISLQIIRPSQELDETIRKSVGLGTWGRTPTRLYGWF